MTNGGPHRLSDADVGVHVAWRVGKRRGAMSVALVNRAREPVAMALDTSKTAPALGGGFPDDLCWAFDEERAYPEGGAPALTQEGGQLVWWEAVAINE